MISDKLQESNLPEWLSSSNLEQMKNRNPRAGKLTSLSRYDLSLSTIIGKNDKDAAGHKLDAQMQMSLKRLRTWDFRIQAHTTDRSLLQASKEPDALKDKLRLPDAIIEKAAHIFRKAQQRGLTKGRTIPGLLAAVVYAACRETGIPRTLKDIATASNIERKHVSKAYRQPTLPNSTIALVSETLARDKLEEETAFLIHDFIMHVPGEGWNTEEQYFTSATHISSRIEDKTKLVTTTANQAQ